MSKVTVYYFKTYDGNTDEAIKKLDMVVFLSWIPPKK